MAAAPPFTRTRDTASFLSIIKYSFEETGLPEELVQHMTVDLLLTCQRVNGQCCGRRSYSHWLRDSLPACKYYQAMHQRFGESATVKVLSECCADPAVVELLFWELGLPAPSWLDEWKRRIAERRPRVEGNVIFFGGFFGDRPEHVVGANLLRDEGSPARKPGGWPRWVRRVKHMIPEEVWNTKPPEDLKKWETSLAAWGRAQLRRERSRA
jgi:hypothetical protein